LANENKLSTIAFPAISCGVYGYPLASAARTSLEACRDHVGNLREVHFVLFSADVFQAYEDAAARLFE
jgi:O-acetyl-ADP-ribose deacetylase (regulator of RNase III)